MKFSNIYLLLFCSLFLTEVSQAQKFNKSFDGFSKKKPIYITMESGEKIESYLKGLKKEEGLIKFVKIKNQSPLTLNASHIKHMYLAPSTFAKIEGVLIEDNTLEEQSKGDILNMDLIKEGYVYFERVPTQVEELTMDVMLQLLNPHFCSHIKVYSNPFASTDGFISVGGVSLVGGLARSYYIRKRTDLLAYKLYSWDYAALFATIFGDSPEFMEKYADDPVWADFEKHIFEYTLLKQEDGSLGK